MADCERFEIAIEQRRHGALAPDEVALLEAHLATCASCVAFDRAGQTMEETMRNATTETLSNMSWSRIEERFATWQRGLNPSVGRLLLAVLAGALGAAVTFFALDPELLGDRAGVVGGIVVPLAVLLWAQWHIKRRAVRDARVAERSRGALLTVYRRQLDERIKAESIARWVLPLLMTGVLVHTIIDPDSTRELVGTIAVVAVMYGISLNSHLRVLPRLRRERAELD